MLDPIKNAFGDIVESVVTPIRNWVLKLSWFARVFIVVAGLSIVWVWNNPAIAYSAVGFADRAVRVSLAGAQEIPISRELNSAIHDSRERLLRVSVNDTNLIRTEELTGWSAAQSLLSIAATPDRKQDGNQLIAYIRGRRLAPCNCWAELNDEDEKKAWTFMSGWVLAALAARQEPADEREVKFLLDLQYADGSWPPIPLKGLNEYASAYTTSWAVLGLLAQKSAHLISNKDLLARSNDAITRGSSWLLTKRLAKARWKPYPNLDSSSISGSVSGLTMHVLHRTMPQHMPHIDQEWLDNLPQSAVPASLGENNYIEIKLGGTRQIDHFVQLTMPWMLIATVDAYQQGGLKLDACVLSKRCGVDLPIVARCRFRLPRRFAENQPPLEVGGGDLWQSVGPDCVGPCLALEPADLRGGLGSAREGSKIGGGKCQHVSRVKSHDL